MGTYNLKSRVLADTVGLKQGKLTGDKSRRKVKAG